MIVRSDFKGPGRVIEDQLGWEQLRRAKLGPCRVCGHDFLNTLHHLVPVGRGQTGDDLAANLVPLCRAHHQAFHYGDRDIATLIGASLRPAEVEYVVGKKSAAWLERRYHRKAAA